MNIAALLFGALAVLSFGFLGGSAVITYFGAGVVLAYARERATQGDWPCEGDDQVDTDEQDRLDAETVRALMLAATRVFNDMAAGFAMLPQDRAELGRALAEAEERFAEWLDWAENARSTKAALAPAAQDA